MLDEAVDSTTASCSTHQFIVELSSISSAAPVRHPAQSRGRETHYRDREQRYAGDEGIHGDPSRWNLRRHSTGHPSDAGQNDQPRRGHEQDAEDRDPPEHSSDLGGWRFSAATSLGVDVARPQGLGRHSGCASVVGGCAHGRRRRRRRRGCCQRRWTCEVGERWRGSVMAGRCLRGSASCGDDRGTTRPRTTAIRRAGRGRTRTRTRPPVRDRAGRACSGLASRESLRSAPRW